MKTRAFATLRHAAVATCIGSMISLSGPAHAADSLSPRPALNKIALQQGSALGRGPAIRPAYGARFPVGAAPYVRPFRGFLLPRVWIAPTYYVPNWQSYGFARPAQGYGWSRYYDDAVLTDRNGRVYDSVQGVNWQAAQSGTTTTVTQTYSPDYDPYNYDSDLLLGNDQVVQGTHWVQGPDDYTSDADYDDAYYADTAPPPVAQYDRDYDPAFLEACRRDSGLGGAAIGAAAGGLAGNRIAGRGNRTGGTLIGAGVGAIAGMVIDKAEDRERCKRLLAQQGNGYPTYPGQPGGYPPPPPGYYYYYPPPIVTTVTITPGSCNCTEEVVVTEMVPAHHPRPVHHTKKLRVYRK